MEQFITEKKLQLSADTIKNNCLFITEYTNSKMFIYSEIIKKCNDSINLFGVPYIEENKSIIFGNHKTFSYDNIQKVDIKLLKQIIEEDINVNLGMYFPNSYFVVSIIEPGYIKTDENTNLLKKRDNYLLDIGIYQKEYTNIKKFSLQNR